MLVCLYLGNCNYGLTYYYYSTIITVINNNVRIVTIIIITVICKVPNNQTTMYYEYIQQKSDLKQISILNQNVGTGSNLRIQRYHI